MQTTTNHPPKGPLIRAINLLIVAVLAGLVAWVLYKFDFFRSARATDNAQVRRHLVPVNSRVQGYLRDIGFQEFAHVNKSDLLVQVDDSEYRLRVAQADASRSLAVAGREVLQTSIETVENNLSVSDSALAEVKVRLDNATKDLERYTVLLAEKVITPSQFDRAKAEADALEAKYQTLRRQRRSTELALNELHKRLEEANAGIQQAEAVLDMAKLNLSYTRVVAPCSGYVGRKELQPGQLIQPGQSLVTIVADERPWVVANFKERRLEKVLPGSRVTVEVDGVPGVVFEGRVAALAQSTGSATSLIPADNAAGNFIKIEQLIPIRIEFSEKNSPESMASLRSGMSATVAVDPVR